ncbi:MAG: MG2 domain-containing protein [Muribaculaceae bacterium]|nr:MG2 domain-containing protein [Muribaculaceae bacterium]
MKPNVPTIKLFFLATAVAICAISITSCSRRLMTADEAAHWIAAYTPPAIDMDSKIRIEMTDAMIAKIDTGILAAECVAFSPKVKGKAVFSSDKRFLDFIPDKSLKQGQRYECRLKMKELAGVDSLGDFLFDFVVAERELRISDVVATVDADDVSMMSVSGTLEYNTEAGNLATSDSTILICDAPSAHIVLDKNAQDKARRFKITGIKRRSSPYTIKISTKPIHGFPKVESAVEIPSVGDFRLLHAVRVDATEPYLDLEFSSPLSAGQELDGLVTIDGVKDLKIEREGCNVKVFYPQSGITDITLQLSELIKSNSGRRLDVNIERRFKQTVLPPAVEIPIEGNILPDNNKLTLPFRAVNLAVVDVEVVKIFPGNVMAFLQDNDLDGTAALRRFGRLVYHRTVRLDKDKSLNIHQWQNFSIDLKGLFAHERGAIYNIRLSFRKAYSLYGRTAPAEFEERAQVSDEERENWDMPYPYIYRAAPDHDWKYYSWNEANDPSKPSYYMQESRMPERNIVASTLGLIAKRGENDVYHLAATDLITASPAAGVEVAAYNYQLQKIATSTTDASGFAQLTTVGSPFMLTASDGTSTTYLKVTPGSELSTSNFDVSGKAVGDGLKGFIYGDRGVWRPGDEVHLSLILEDRHGALPKSHPVVMELFNPAEQLYARRTLSESIDGFYVFHVRTDEDVPTGIWTAHFKVGNQTFRHKVRIETIKPNRLKINITAPAVFIANKAQETGLDARWLTGPAAKGMNASMEMALYSDSHPFGGYKKYTFSNPLVKFTSSQKQILSGRLDSIGSIRRYCTVGADINSPGMLRANITAKVSEPGGDVSISSRSVQFSPFDVYIGVDLSVEEYCTDTDLQIPVVVLNKDGEKLKNRELSYKIYRLDWTCWREGAENLSRYVKSSSADLVASGRVTATDGVAAVPFRVNYPDWGKYLVLVRDTKGGHASGGTIMVDWPQWRGRANRSEAGASTELSFTLDKKSYEAGEVAKVYLPKCKGGRVLLSVETGSGIIRKYWVNTSADKETCFKLPVNAAMAPNFYVTATMMRPHRLTRGDAPIRLFGVAGASVVDKRTILHPEIEMPDELHPRQSFSIKVKERDGKPMTYTLAIVDEGLLDISNFSTPRPWAAMYEREALGVKTWDMYDKVVGAFGSNFRPVLSIGGDEALRKSAGKEKRFNPVVKFIGPFTLSGGKASHRLTLPNYVGSVRVMIVAAHDGCYGNTDKTVKVTSPLMLLTTLPRTLACGDAVDMAVNVFAMKDEIKDLTVKVETAGPLSVSGPATKRLTYSAVGEKLENFRLRCSQSEEGRVRIVVSTAGGSFSMSDTIFIEVKNPMPIQIDERVATLKPGESTELTWHPEHTMSACLQISSMPTISFGRCMEFFENYEHLCSEQLASKALFMLYGRQALSADKKDECEKALPGITKSVAARQLPDGGFVYWPGREQANTWVTSMAGLALVEANRQGIRVNRETLDKWVEYQEKTARNYCYSESTDADQAFRLYSLAKAGKAMKSAMNRLRESKKLSQTAAYCLASAYAVDGRRDVAASLIDRAERTPYTQAEDMFGSSLRDKALALEAYMLCEKTAEAIARAQELAEQCAGAEYVTQDVAFTTMAMQAQSNRAGKVSVDVSESGKAVSSFSNLNSVKNIGLSATGGKVSVSNTGSSPVVLSLTTTGRMRAADCKAAKSKDLAVKVSYTDMNGKAISAERLTQDAEFYACVAVTNKGSDIQAMALTYSIPSGWEIWNPRLFGGSAKSIDYLDIRDDRVIYYSALASGKTQTYKIRLRAAYVGNFILPPAVCEDMYKPSRRAFTEASGVSVEKI